MVHSSNCYLQKKCFSFVFSTCSPNYADSKTYPQAMLTVTVDCCHMFNPCVDHILHRRCVDLHYIPTTTELFQCRPVSTARDCVGSVGDTAHTYDRASCSALRLTTVCRECRKSASWPTFVGRVASLRRALR